jgi:hypothetical protein
MIVNSELVNAYNNLMRMKTARLSCIVLAMIFFLSGGMNAFAGWETGAAAGFDSNIDRSVNSGESDTYLTAYASLIWEPSGESRLSWSGAATLQGTSFARNSDLNYAVMSISPGATYFPHAFWRVNISPFLEAKAVNDSDQSALTFGGQVSMRQKIGRDFYTGQYYIYKDSQADVETYSYTEHVIGVFLGVNWTKAFFSEVGYEFSRGDSFRTVSTSSTIASGRGKHRIYSEAFGTEVIREKVDQNAIGVSAGIDWTESLFSYIAYTYTTINGDLGSSTSHAGSLGIGYGF